MNWSIGRGPVIGFALVAGVLVASAAASYLNLRRLDDNARRVAHTEEVRRAIDDVLSTVKDAETGQRGYVITGNPRYLEPYRVAVADIRKKIDALKHSTADDARLQANVLKLEGLVETKFGEMEETVKLRGGSLEAALRVIEQGHGQADMERIRDLVRQMDREAEGDVKKSEQESARSQNVAVLTEFLTTLLGLGMVAAAAYLLKLDLAARRRAAEAVREQQEWFHITLASIGDAVVATDAGGRVTFLNAVAEKLTGWVADEAKGQPLTAVLPLLNETTRRPVANPVDRVLEKGQAVGLANHTTLVRRDGREVPIEDSAAPIRDGRGRVIGVVLVFRDVAEERQAREALRQSEERLRRQAQRLLEADRHKDEFLATLVHELRNPLAPIRTALHALRLMPGADEAHRQMLDVMDRQVRQLNRLIEDLLDVSRIARGKLEVRKERVDLARVVNQAVETSRPLLDAAGHELTVTPPPEPVAVDADPARLAQVLSNLLNNAAKYTEPGGRVWVSAGREGGTAVVRVRDTGAGIPAELLPRVFEMYEQLGVSGERARGGLGIGLTLVKKLVEMHGGTVEAASEGPGRGSEFTVRLPAAGGDMRG